MSTRGPRAGWTEETEPARSWKSGAEVEPKQIEGDLRNVVEAARLLLDHAARRGLIVSPSIAEPITRVEREVVTGAAPDAATAAGFLGAYEALCRLTASLAGDSHTIEPKDDQRRTRRLYFLFLAGLMLIAVPLTTISTVGGKLSADIAAQISSTCRDYPVLYCDPSTRNEETSYDHYPYSVNDLTTRTSHISESLWVLAFFDDLLQSTNLRRDLPKVSIGPDQNIWSSFTEIFYRSGTIIDRFKLYYGTLANYLLPIVFGMLGAVTFGLRELRHWGEAPGIGGRGSTMMALLRILIAGLAGYLVTVTDDLVSGVQVPLIFVAFLLGYSIDVFFALLDKAVLRVKAINAPHRPRTNRG
jgi:hypothetical protein